MPFLSFLIANFGQSALEYTFKCHTKYHIGARIQNAALVAIAVMVLVLPKKLMLQFVLWLSLSDFFKMTHHVVFGK